MKHRIATLVAALGLLLGGAMIATPAAARDSFSIAIGTPGYAGYSDYYYAPSPTYYYGPPVVTYGYGYERPYHHRYHHHYYYYGEYPRDYYRGQ